MTTSKYLDNFYITIFLDSYRDTSSPVLKNNADYPYEIRYYLKNIDLKKLHIYLINNNYFIRASIEDVLNTLKVKDLKRILERNGIVPTGRRKTNMEKIKNISPSKIINYLPNNYKNYYSISPKGLEFIKNNYDFILIKKHYNFKIDEELYCNFRNSDHSFFSTCEQLFLSQLKDDFDSDSSYTKKILFDKLSKLYDLYNFQKKALFYALAELYIELSCDSTIPTLAFINLDLTPVSLKSRQQQILSEFNNYVSPQDDTIDIIYKNRQHYDERMIKKIFSIPLSLNVCSEEYFKQIIKGIFNNSFNKEETIKNIKQMFRNINFIKK